MISSAITRIGKLFETAPVDSLTEDHNDVTMRTNHNKAISFIEKRREQIRAIETKIIALDKQLEAMESALRIDPETLNRYERLVGQLETLCKEHQKLTHYETFIQDLDKAIDTKAYNAAIAAISARGGTLPSDVSRLDTGHHCIVPREPSEINTKIASVASLTLKALLNHELNQYKRDS